MASVLKQSYYPCRRCQADTPLERLTRAAGSYVCVECAQTIASAWGLRPIVADGSVVYGPPEQVLMANCSRCAVVWGLWALTRLQLSNGEGVLCRSCYATMGQLGEIP